MRRARSSGGCTVTARRAFSEHDDELRQRADPSLSTNTADRRIGHLSRSDFLVIKRVCGSPPLLNPTEREFGSSRPNSVRSPPVGRDTPACWNADSSVTAPGEAVAAARMFAHPLPAPWLSVEAEPRDARFRRVMEREGTTVGRPCPRRPELTHWRWWRRGALDATGKAIRLRARLSTPRARP
jgi:hypothetical protein